MLSIVKMDFDSDPSIDEVLVKSEMIDIVEEPIGNQGSINKATYNLELAPVVYTTRLDDMTVLKSNPVQMNPEEVTNRIIKESKPVLRMMPINSGRKRRNKNFFRTMKAILQNIYCSSKMINNNHETDMTLNKPDIQFNRMPDRSNIVIDLCSVKSEVQDEPGLETIKSNDRCKYSELLKLCKPCSVVIIRLPSEQVIHGGEVLHANREQNPTSRGQSSDDDEPLITFPNLLVSRNIPRKNESKKNRKIHFLNIDKNPKNSDSVPVNIIKKPGLKVTELSQIHQRLMRNGLLEVHDSFSKECHIYFTDSESNLLEYFRDTDKNDITLIYETPNSRVDYKYIAENCCWVKRDTSLKSLYPKVLTYPNSRFMKRPHPCKPGACVCCCRKKENVKKPSQLFTENTEAEQNNDEKGIIDLEDEIDKSIITISRTPKLDSNEWLRDLLTKRGTDKYTKENTLIGKALSYNKPLPKKVVENRRLVTFLQKESHNTVIILRNFAMDITEIYEISVDGDIETYNKTSCFNNTSHPDVRKLLRNPSAINESVCCWFKREEVLTKLYNAKTLHHAALKFIRTHHHCPSTECTCCCKPITKKKVTLTDINLPTRPLWTAVLKSNKPAYETESQLGEPKFVSTKAVPPKTDPSNMVSVTFPTLHNEPPPLVSIPSSKPLTSQSDDDCEITSITTSPILQAVLQNPTVPVAVPAIPVVVPTMPEVPQGLVVNSDELSQEVNSLITSILDRFKDVRLTINDDGKVAAALNTPVSTLSTVELKVLANILSYAQNQINLLGLKGNSGMRLSNIINLKVDDQAKSNLDPNSVYKEFGKNVNLSNAQNFQTTSNVMQAKVGIPLLVPTYHYFTNTMSVRNQHFNDAFSSYVTSKIDPNPHTESFAPVIENVFTLKEESDPEPSSTTVWYRKPAAQQTSVSNTSENRIKTNSNTNKDNKRKDMETTSTNSKKIRILSPSKLGAATSNPGGIATTPVGTIMPEVGFVPNKQKPFPSLGNAQMQSIITGALPASPSQPILIINPLNTHSFINTGDTVAEPFANNVVNTKNSSNLQMPIIVSASASSHVATTVNANVTMAQDANTLNTPIVAEVEVSRTGDNPEEGNSPDDERDNVGEVDYNLDNDVDMENEAEVDYSVENEAELDYSVENEAEEKFCPDNEEEEDCILGF